MLKKILIVEDEEFLVDAYKTKLSLDQFDVTIARDGEEALQLVSQVIPDLIILDIILPGKSGLEVLKEIKTQPALAAIPVLIASNLDQQETINTALSLGAKDYFVKSNISIIDLVEKITSVLQAWLFLL